MAPLLFAALTGTMAMTVFVAFVRPAARHLGLLEWVAGLMLEGVIPGAALATSPAKALAGQ